MAGAMPDALSLAAAVPSRVEPLAAPWRELRRYGAIDSTQRLAGRLAAAGQDLTGVVLWAETQAAGHGRQGRSWTSEAGGLYVTAGLPTLWTGEMRWIGWIPLAAALACAGLIRQAWGVPALVKWPNDVLVDGRKLAGVLGEAALIVGGKPGKLSRPSVQGEASKPSESLPRLLLVGMGVNWTNPARVAGRAGGFPATALADHVPGLGLDSREGYLRDWLTRLADDVAALMANQAGTAERLRQAAEALLWRRGEIVTLRHTEQGEARGRLLGLTLDAQARLEMPDGAVTEIGCGWQAAEQRT
jgi:biotin-(acetyl-CoA carboxylase) ligase